MRLLLYPLFILGFAVLGGWIEPVLGFFGAAAGWLVCATGLWMYDYGTDGEPWGFMDWIYGTDIGPAGSIGDFGGFDGGCDGGCGGD